MDFNEIFMTFVYALISALAVLTIKYVVKFINEIIKYFKVKIENIKNENFKNFCKDMMQAAETMTTELLNGEEKKKWVTEKLVLYAKKENINVTEEYISDLVQSIFLELDGITLNKHRTNFPENEEINKEELIEEAINRVLNELYLGTEDDSDEEYVEEQPVMFEDEEE